MRRVPEARIISWSNCVSFYARARRRDEKWHDLLVPINFTKPIAIFRRLRMFPVPHQKEEAQNSSQAIYFRPRLVFPSRCIRSTTRNYLNSLQVGISNQL